MSACISSLVGGLGPSGQGRIAVLEHVIQGDTNFGVVSGTKPLLHHSCHSYRSYRSLPQLTAAYYSYHSYHRRYS
jgi:hypothetical protein